MTHPILKELRELGLSDIADEVYGAGHAARYVEDLKVILPLLRGPAQILEIAPYIGWLGIQLRKLGHAVSTVQPEHHQSQLQRRFDHYGITTKCAVFPKDRIPYPPKSFDLVIFCETLEHFAFNPVPVLRQIHEVLKPGGFLYVTTPNQATLKNAVKLAAGHSINESVTNFFFDPNCYDPQGHLDFGLHWREYSMDQLCLLLKKTGFEIRSRRFRLYPLYPPAEKSFRGAVREIFRTAYRSLYVVWPSLVGSLLEVVAARSDAESTGEVAGTPSQGRQF
jgi:SAM-dependent methyltransferase